MTERRPAPRARAHRRRAGAPVAARPLRARPLVLALPLVALALVWQRARRRGLADASSSATTLAPLQGDKLSRLFATIFALMAFGGALFALGQKSRVEVPAAFVYAGAAIGVALAGDLRHACSSSGS